MGGGWEKSDKLYVYTLCTVINHFDCHFIVYTGDSSIRGTFLSPWMIAFLAFKE